MITLKFSNKKREIATISLNLWYVASMRPLISYLLLYRQQQNYNLALGRNYFLVYRFHCWHGTS